MDERGREGHVRMYHKLTIDQYNVMTEEEIKIAADKVKWVTFTVTLDTVCASWVVYLIIDNKLLILQ